MNALFGGHGTGRCGRGGWWLAACLLACAGSQAKDAENAGAVKPRDTRILHEDCPVNDSDAVGEDVNGDGRPDRTTVRDGSIDVCRALDFNFDGLVDAWVYMDASGQVRRRESDYDRDGRVDEVSLYRAGELTERHRATTLAGKLDTWHFYEAGQVTRTERDSNGDDYVDQWWEYPAGRDPKCPLVHSDVDGDGRPDPGATVDVCKDEYAPPPRDGDSDAPGSSRGVGDLPVEEDESAPGEGPPPSDSAPDGASGGEADEEDDGFGEDTP